jgi:hypothetical protein
MVRRSLFFVVLAWSSLAALAQNAQSQNERHFNFHYAFTVENVSPGERVRTWVPLAHSTKKPRAPPLPSKKRRTFTNTFFAP